MDTLTVTLSLQKIVASIIIVIRNGKMETRVVLLIFSFELKISGVAVQRIHQYSEKWWLLLNYFEAVLPTFYCYDYGANTFEAVQNIAADQKDHHKCSSCFSLLNSHNISINNSEKGLVTRTFPT